MRMDQIWPGIYPDGMTLAQLYPSCAQINVENGNGTLPAGVKIPEVFIHQAPGMYTSLGMATGKKIDNRWEYPGGPIWDGVKLTQDVPAKGP
jgi:hypothetical protein